MFATESSLNLSNFDYIEKVNEKARSYSENERIILKRILSNIVERVISKKEEENKVCQ